MSKFQKLYESFLKKSDKVTDKEFAEIAKKVGYNKPEAFAEFMRKRFKGELLSSAYVEEWAGRLKKGTGWNYGDEASQKIMKELGIGK